MKEKRNVPAFLVLLALFALSRWPGVFPPNFSAAYALVFLGAIFLPRSLIWLPLLIIALSDVALNVHYDAPLISGYMVLNYGAFAVVGLLGRGFRPQNSFLKLLGGGILGALLFYVITNTAAWLNNAPSPFPQEPYPKTLLGWIQALTVGSPHWPPTITFLRNTLLSGGLFTGVIVGIMRLVEKQAPEPEAETEEQEAVPASEQPLAEETKA